jgi:predicted XRE-type DNA-binding protein
MNKIKRVVTRNADQLARALRLSKAEGVELAVRSRINDKLIDAVKRSGLSHSEVARIAQTSRTRLTAILNRDTSHVSTDLMLRIMGALGYRTKITFSRPRSAA